MIFLAGLYVAAQRSFGAPVTISNEITPLRRRHRALRDTPLGSDLGRRNQHTRGQRQISVGGFRGGSAASPSSYRCNLISTGAG